MSVSQISSMLDYLEGQPELALSTFSRSKEGRTLAKNLWQECASILNNDSAGCIQRTPDLWRMTHWKRRRRNSDDSVESDSES